MKLEVVPVTAFQQNCSVLWCEKTRRAAIVDPGGDLERVLSVIESHTDSHSRKF
jgi:hydroxyacylglutathione hydrolase